MQMWTIRKGLEFYPEQDTPDKHRLKLIEQITDFNRLDLYYNAIVKDFLTSGGILWHLKHTDTGEYQILWYDKNHYRLFRGADGLSVSRVVVIYPYEDPQFTYLESTTKERWVKLQITADWIRAERFMYKPSLDDRYEQHLAPFDFQVYENPLGIIPCVESPNNPDKPGDSGCSEFEPVTNQIGAEDSIRCAMLQNLSVFGNPTLITSLPKERVYEQYGDLEGNRIAGLQYSWAAQQGYQSATTMASGRAGMPGGFLAKNKYGVGGWASQPGHVVRIVGNVKANDRFAYLQVEPISTDQWTFAKEYKEGIHEALGGIDPLGSFATFGELKSLHGKVAATAQTKSLSLWTHGLCKVFELAIWIEEQIYQSAAGQLLLKSFKPEELTIDLIQRFYEAGAAPKLPGIPPYGNRTVQWRHKGPVFEDSPDDKLQLSIVCRNLQELGVGSLEAMRYLFPDKTEAEIKALLTGVPFRYIQQTISSLSGLLQLQQQLFQVPDPQNPSLPLANRFDVSPLLAYTLNNLMREISYGAEYEPSSSSSPTVSSAAPTGFGDPISNSTSSSAYAGSTSGFYGSASSWLSGQPTMGNASTLPTPGAVLDTARRTDSYNSIAGISSYPAIASSSSAEPEYPAINAPRTSRRNPRNR